MPLPEVQINIQDPGLGIVPASAGRTQVKAGVCNKGALNTLYSAGSIQAARDAIGLGPILDAAAQVLAVAGGPVLLLPVLPTTYGAVTSSFVLSGSGTGTVAGSKGPEQVVAIKIILGGTLGTATFQVKVGNGQYGPTVPTVNSPPWNYLIPGQSFTTAQFAAGTYVANDVYTINLDGTVTRVGSGTATLLDGSTHSPVDAYDVWVEVLTSGGLGVGAYRYSLDGGNNWSGSLAIPAGGKYVIPSTGVVLTFAGTFTAGDVYKGTAAAADFSNSDLTAALTALLANPSEWGFVHVVGKPANAAAAVTRAATVGAQMLAAQAAFRFVRGIVECPQEEGDNTIKTAFAAVSEPRVGVVVGDVGLTSPLTGRRDRRNLAWAYTARLSATKLSTHPGQVDNSDNGGALKNVTSLYRDEQATPGLDETRFVTARSIIGLPGYYVTRGRMMASPGSDFSQIMNCRVMDRACTVARAGFVLFLNKNVRVNGNASPSPGTIHELSAREIEAVVGAKLKSAIVDEGEASDTGVTVSRTDNLLSSSTLNVEVEIIPFGYLEFIKVAIGFKNPVLAQQQAA
jgi:hypothetical protein